MPSVPVAPDQDSIRRDWTQAAAGWRKWHREFAVQSREATKVLIQAAAVQPGMQILDLASGSGEPAVSLAQAVGPAGGVLATDLVSDMLLGTRAHAAELGRRNMDFIAASADALPFHAKTFDRVTCRFGVMFFADISKALAEIERVLKPRGRLAFAAWADASRNNFFAATTDVLRKFSNSPPQNPDLAHRFAEPGSLSAALRQSTLQDVAEDYHSIAWPWPGPPEQFWDYSVEVRRSFRKLLESLSPEQQREARIESIREMSRFYDGRQVNFSACIVIATGVRPA
ncbi:MAG TPA: class I SAM-dependent methyltransferase [Bryobacteraceae bacterium]|nr:class I SAM-dependent methyltransferase [Bryobacteraceae bacterium]